MKKKILFMMINMNVGGMEKALLNMISTMPQDRYDITIFMLEEYGGFLDLIPSGVKVEYFSGYEGIKDILNQPPQLEALKLVKNNRFIKGGIILLLHIITKFLKDRSIYYHYVLRNYQVLKDEYDIAIAYAGPNDFISYFVANKIKANQKYQWIHFDVTKIGFNQRFAVKIYSKFDKIFVVSSEAKEKLNSLLPELKEKTSVFQNIVSPHLICSQAKEGQGFNDHLDGIRILTVGRLSIEKGQDLAIRALAKLRADGFNVRWYFVGEGNSRKSYEKLIKEYNLQDYIFLLGSEPNPYLYMDQCDIYVQPSRHEGYCLTLAEAKCFKKPIVTTNFTGAKEQIRNMENGIISGISADEIYYAIRLIIEDKGLREKITRKLDEEYSCSDNVEVVSI